jgi:hypothetical protein
MKSTIVERLKLFSRCAGYFSLALGLLVLTGWAFDISWAKSIHPSWIAMRVNTALCFVLSGAAILMPQQTNTSKVIKAMAGVIGILGALNLLQ